MQVRVIVLLWIVMNYSNHNDENNNNNISNGDYSDKHD